MAFRDAYGIEHAVEVEARTLRTRGVWRLIASAAASRVAHGRESAVTFGPVPVPNLAVRHIAAPIRQSHFALSKPS